MRGATNREFKGTKRGVYSKETGSLLRPKWGFGRLKPCDLYVLEYQVVRVMVSGGGWMSLFLNFSDIIAMDNRLLFVGRSLSFSKGSLLRVLQMPCNCITEAL